MSSPTPLSLLSSKSRRRWLTTWAALVPAWLGLALARAADAGFTPDQLDYFEKKVRPVLVERCYSCHSAGSKKLKGDLHLDSRAGFLKGGESGKPSLNPGDPDHSLFIDAIRYGNQDLQMPPKGRLADEEVADLTEWVRMGAPWPTESPTASTAKKNEFDLAARRGSHWAWRPITRPTPPGVKETAWPVQPIDRFLLARLEQVGLTPAPPAPRATLLRRLYFDLIGLPPSPQQVAAFEADPSPDALVHVVDELLASPRFGERWARHWLDLVRYAETLAHEFDFPRHNAWRYRDYVIRALNSDLPYDQFVTEHLAGDLLDNPRRNPTDGSNESMIATAFWWFGQQVHSPVDIRVHQSDVIDNQIDVATKTFLGLTVACARCHDHKFDAISTKDFYALYGMLSSSRYSQRSIEPPDASRAAAAQLSPLRKDLRAALATDWLAGNATLAARLAAQPTNPAIVRLRSNFPLTNAAPAKPAPTPLPTEGIGYAANLGGGLPEGWLVDGDAFRDAAAVAGDFVIGPGANAQSGIRLVTEDGQHSGRLARRLEGALRSPTIVISNRYLHVRCSGRDSRFNAVIANFTMIQAPIYGELRRVIDFDEPRWVTIDLNMWKGQRLFVEFNDLATPDPASGGRTGGYGPNGWIAVHQLLLSDNPQPPAMDPGPTKPVEEPAGEWENRVQARAQTALQAWRDTPDGTATPDREGLRLVDALLAAGLLGGSPQSAADPLVQKYREVDGRIPEPRFVPAMVDGTGLDENVFIRGSARTPGEPVPRRFLEALGGSERPFRHGSGRLEFAHQLLEPSNPLPARVLVNRVWLHLFGRGIVPTPDDFGVLGQPPSHPELLDWLADWFRTEGHWSVKQLVRLLVTSRAYAMASVSSDPHALEKDPDNLLLHRMPVRRLEGEIIRDALLSLSGRLDPTMYGPSVPTHLTEFMDGRGRPGSSGPADGNGRRSIYLEVRNNFLSPMMRTFDTPVPFTTVGRRTVSNVPAQSLILMNDPFVLGQAQLWAKRSLEAGDMTPPERIRHLYARAFGRTPNPAELSAATAFLNTQGEALGVAPPERRRDLRLWTDLCHALINVKEFIYLN